MAATHGEIANERSCGMYAQMNCTKCSNPIPEGFLNNTFTLPCPSCGAQIQAFVFPAFYMPMGPVDAGESLTFEGESSCYYHPNKKASVHCQGCGRFLCSLCDVELNAHHLCPACLETGAKKGTIENMDNTRTNYENMALHLAVVPILFFFPTILTAPIALYIAIRYWRSPSSMVFRTKARFILAILLALPQVAGWLFYFISLYLETT
jgi:hypothetical protein